MKKINNLCLIAVTTLLVWLATPSAKAQSVGRTNSIPSVTLAWNQSPDPSVANYNLYMGSSSGNYTNVVATGNVSQASTVPGALLRGVTYFWAVTAVSTNGLESLYSNEAIYSVPNLPGAPTSTTVKIKSP